MARVVRWLAVRTGILLAVLAAGALATYLLALVALYDMERPPALAIPGSVSGARSVGMGPNGGAQVWQGSDTIAAPSGSGAPVVTANLIGDGRTLLTTALDGSVRLTDVEASARLTAAAMPRLSATFYTKLWKPYGAPVAQNALWLAAQVLPLHVPQSRKGQRGRVFRDCANCPEMVEIGPGAFLMGSPWTEWGALSNERPRTLVQLAQPFAVGKYEVTFEQWDACFAATACKSRPDDRGWGRGQQPAINTSWQDAQDFTNWLSKKTNQTYRLPSEAEWEYMARAGATSKFWWGDGTPLDKENFNGEFIQTGAGFARVGNMLRPVPVGSFDPNPWGLHDVHGNVAEWTQDCWNERQDQQTRPGRSQKECKSRTIRGGSWSSNTDVLRAAYRLAGPIETRQNSLGFRVARTLDP